MFPYLDLFIIVLWCSLVMKGASFARRYFFLIGASLLKMEKIDSLNRPKSVLFKEKVWRTPGYFHIASEELLRHSDGLANQSFCQSDISSVQLKSNWTVGESLLVFGQEAVREWRLNLLKGHWKILQCLILSFNDFQKHFCEGNLR